MPAGNIVGTGTVDTVSFIGPHPYPPLPIGGPPEKECEKIKINIAPSGEDAQYQNALILDTSPAKVSQFPYPDAPASDGGPPPTIVRPSVLPGTGVFFEGQEVAVSVKSSITGLLASPLQRPLTEPTSYPKIIIGTKPV